MRVVVAVVAVVGAAVALAGCTSPEFGDGHLQCATSGRACPSGFYCAGDDHCWRDGSGPPAGGVDMTAAEPDLVTAIFDLAAADLAIAPSKCAGSAARLCEGFESATALASWTQSLGNGLLARDTSRAYRGVASLHATIVNAPVMTNAHAVISETSTFPIATTVYVRVWAYFPSASLPPTFDQPLALVASGGGGVSEGIDTGRVTINDYATPQYYHSSATLMPLDRWTCLQMDMSQTGTSGPINLSVDGTPLGDIGAGNVSTPAATSFSVGLDFYGNTVAIPQYDAWFDEIIVDDHPTSCND